MSESPRPAGAHAQPRNRRALLIAAAVAALVLSAAIVTVSVGPAVRRRSPSTSIVPSRSAREPSPPGGRLGLAAVVSGAEKRREIAGRMA